MKAWDQPHAAPTVAHIVVSARTDKPPVHFVTLTGQEFRIELSPDMADTLADRLRECAQRARTATTNQGGTDDTGRRQGHGDWTARSARHQVPAQPAEAAAVPLQTTDRQATQPDPAPEYRNTQPCTPQTDRHTGVAGTGHVGRHSIQHSIAGHIRPFRTPEMHRAWILSRTDLGGGKRRAEGAITSHRINGRIYYFRMHHRRPGC